MSNWRSTPFGQFVTVFTVRRLVEVLHEEGQPITRRAVYSWCEGRHVPRPSYANALVRISGGQITWPDIYGHREVVNGTDCGAGSMASRANDGHRE